MPAAHRHIYEVCTSIGLSDLCYIFDVVAFVMHPPVLVRCELLELCLFLALGANTLNLSRLGDERSARR